MRLRSKLLAIISEIALWGLIVLVIYGLASVFVPKTLRDQFAQGQTIKLQFKDASQLAVGSPVNFMGTDVGFVTRVQPRGNSVIVELKTYPDAVAIPPGAHFTVEFNGLAGAKTLEILPPAKTQAVVPQPENTPFIVDEPIRIRDVMKTQMVLAEALEYSSNNFAQSLGEVQDQKQLIDDLHDINQRILEVDRTLVYAYATMAHQAQKIHGTIVNAADSIGSFQMMLDDVRKMTDPAFFRTNTMATLRSVTHATEDTYHTLTDAQNEQHIAQFELKVTKTHKAIAKTKAKLAQSIPKAMNTWCRFNDWLCRTEGFLRQANEAFLANPPLDRLHRFRDKAHKWSQFKPDF